MQLVYTLFLSPLGWCAAVKGAGGLVRVFLPERSRSALKNAVEQMFRGIQSDSRALEKEIRQLERYFAAGSTAPPFTCRVDMSGATPFQRRVWSAVCDIAFGQVRTYGQVALAVGSPRAGRAVGAALAANPVPLVVPCHRVIRADGGLGGFSASAGVELKRRLLAHEGVNIGRD
jgi:methylated-DNA-[protein]-cysteine S-methyltransferase